MRAAPSIALTMCLTLCAEGLAQGAAARRYALLVGNDRGLAADLPLRFAEADAQRMARLLNRLGGFAEEDTTVLVGRRAPAVRRALIEINDRIRRQRGRTVLFVYYSGHADAQGLHLAGSRLPTEELRKLVTGSAASTRVLVLDACRSGSATRVKGARPVAAFAIDVEDHLRAEGFAIITSSAATEDSQESDRLRGSFFTHFFISGLRGAADRNGDRRISLAEAYAYAYGNTLRETSRTVAGPQHPTYEYGIRGRGNLVLTALDRAAGHGALRFLFGGTFLVMQGAADGPVVAELVTERASRRLLLPEGRYFVRQRADDHLLEGRVTVRAGETVTVHPATMRRVAYAQLVRKGGGSSHGLSHGPVLSYLIHGAQAGGLGPVSMVELGYALELRWLSLIPRVALGWAGQDNAFVSTDQRELALSLGAARVFDLGPLSLSLGLVGGWSTIHQSFVSQGTAPDRDSHGGLFGGEAGLSLELGAGLFFAARGAGITYLFRRGNGAEAEIDPVFTYQLAAGLGWHIR